ncbi:zonular occludens toxin domain-containing protein [Aquabacterium sp.]|uniref:zonular occludens toxin domain-containing protein n=1 Tax=Aquabacterium sp. TaxID=1872578 RepID=UPI0037830AA1
MAIVLITGLPGHGKTLYTIATYRELAAKDRRPVYHAGLKGLKLAWQEHKPEEWQALPPNAIFIIDEAQFVFPLRGRGAPPDWVQRLATHRHQGIDIVVITQDPMLLDSFVRRLCDRHLHIVRKFGTHFAVVHEYANGVHDRVAHSRGDSMKREWRYPEDVFELYHSAEVHTVKRRIPGRVYALAAAPLVLGGLVYSVYHRHFGSDAAAAAAPALQASAPVTYKGGAVPPVAGQARGNQALTVAQYVELHRPRVEGLAYTAAVYDQVTQPVEAPYPAACVASQTRCKCYSQQGTALETPEDLCRGIAAGGFFIAWKQQAQQPGQPQQAVAAPAAAPVAGGPVSIGGDRRAGLEDLRDRPDLLPAPGGGGVGRQGRAAR